MTTKTSHQVHLSELTHPSRRPCFDHNVDGDDDDDSDNENMVGDLINGIGILSRSLY